MADALPFPDDESADSDVPGATFSLREACTLLRIPGSLLRTLLDVPGLCPLWDSRGRISENTVRMLYSKLHGGV